MIGNLTIINSKDNLAPNIEDFQLIEKQETIKQEKEVTNKYNNTTEVQKEINAIFSGKEIKTIFAGAGAKGALYPGMLKALEELGLNDNIHEVNGTSAGSIVGALYAAGCSCKDLEFIMDNSDFTKLKHITGQHNSRAPLLGNNGIGIENLVKAGILLSVDKFLQEEVNLQQNNKPAPNQDLTENTQQSSIPEEIREKIAFFKTKVNIDKLNQLAENLGISPNAVPETLDKYTETTNISGVNENNPKDVSTIPYEDKIMGKLNLISLILEKISTLSDISKEKNKNELFDALNNPITQTQQEPIQAAIQHSQPLASEQLQQKKLTWLETGLTFEELKLLATKYPNKFRHININAVKAADTSHVYFSSKATEPLTTSIGVTIDTNNNSTGIAQAVRASMSIPLVFKEYKGYYDGGIFANSFLSRNISWTRLRYNLQNITSPLPKTRENPEQAPVASNNSPQAPVASNKSVILAFSIKPGGRNWQSNELSHPARDELNYYKYLIYGTLGLAATTAGLTYMTYHATVAKVASIIVSVPPGPAIFVLAFVAVIYLVKNMDILNVVKKSNVAQKLKDQHFSKILQYLGLFLFNNQQVNQKLNDRQDIYHINLIAGGVGTIDFAKITLPEVQAESKARGYLGTTLGIIRAAMGELKKQKQALDTRNELESSALNQNNDTENLAHNAVNNGVNDSRKSEIQEKIDKLSNLLDIVNLVYDKCAEVKDMECVKKADKAVRGQILKESFELFLNLDDFITKNANEISSEIKTQINKIAQGHIDQYNKTRTSLLAQSMQWCTNLWICANKQAQSYLRAAA